MRLVSNRTPLSALESLNEEQATRLEVLGVRSVEALAARLSPLNEEQLEIWSRSTYLSKAELLQLGKSAETRSASFLSVSSNLPPVLAAKGALPPPGTMADTSTVTQIEPLLRVARNLAQGEGVNYISRLGPIRSQGLRGTCVAHAMCALKEFYLGEDGTDLSEQFLYWWCKEHDGLPGISGTFVATARQGLENIGVCLESTWPYVKIPGSSEGQGPPPEQAIAEAPQYKLSGLEMLPDPRNVNRIIQALDAGKLVAVSIKTYSFWTDPEIRRSGQISLPLGEPSTGGHAVLVVGYDAQDESFIFRNSWDVTWAFESPYGPGYGSLPYPYIAQDGWEACC